MDPSYRKVGSAPWGWHGHVKRREDAYVGRRVLGIELPEKRKVRRPNCRFMDAICLWVVYTERGRDRPKTRYSDNIRDTAGIRSIVAIYRQVQDRDKWRATAVRRQISVSCSLPSLSLDISVNWMKQPGSV